MNLPELYAACVAKHPRLRVPNGRCSLASGPKLWFIEDDDVAAALIADHWENELPNEHWMYRGGPKCWIVCWNGPDREIEGADDAPARLGALGAFWLAYEGSGK